MNGRSLTTFIWAQYNILQEKRMVYISNKFKAKRGKASDISSKNGQVLNTHWELGCCAGPSCLSVQPPATNDRGWQHPRQRRPHRIHQSCFTRSDNREELSFPLTFSLWWNNLTLPASWQHTQYRIQNCSLSLGIFTFTGSRIVSFTLNAT